MVWYTFSEDIINWIVACDINLFTVRKHFKSPKRRVWVMRESFFPKISFSISSMLLKRLFDWQNECSEEKRVLSTQLCEIFLLKGFFLRCIVEHTQDINPFFYLYLLNIIQFITFLLMLPNILLTTKILVSTECIEILPLHTYLRIT